MRLLLVVAVVLLIPLQLVSCAANSSAQAQQSAPASVTPPPSAQTPGSPPTTAAVAAVPAPAVAAADNAQDFAAWLANFRREAGTRGINDATLDAAFSNLKGPLPRVLELDHNQPEFVQTLAGYLRPRISETRIQRGRDLLVKHKDLLKRIEQKYGVQPQYLVAFWGLESNFGGDTGGFSVITATATLAYDPRRSQMFRDELLTALQIIQAGHIKANEMTGSWTGAMGQCQFMPSTFKNYAVDGDGDGRIDIWHSIPDVLTSAANYLAKSGWKAGERWGREVVLPANFDFANSGTGIRKTVSEWNALGVRKADGTPLGNADIQASLVVPAGAKGPAFLTYNNFRITMVWNRSVNYAISVGYLADRLMGEEELRHKPDPNEPPLNRAAVEEMQTLLNAAGLDVGKPDGVPGTRTRDAVREYQFRNHLIPDGYASYEFLETLRKGVQAK